VGKFDRSGAKLVSELKPRRRGKDGSVETGENQKTVSTGSHTPLEISQTARDSHFSTARTTIASPYTKLKTKKTKKAARAA
jgi:hypothetical protein